jgi:glycosyltransferase involved in cell wall biosynthesis
VDKDDREQPVPRNVRRALINFVMPTTVPLRVLVVGQTPPPLHGQAIMIERLVSARMRQVELKHVRMAFSTDIAEVGRMQANKIGRLVVLIARIWAARFRYHSEVLYYPPAGPHRVPMYRDIVVLLSCRWLFRRTIFHFHAGGLGDFAATLSRWQRLLFWLAYRHPDCAILLSDRNPPDGARVGARRSISVPYGIPDEANGYRRGRPFDAVPRILYMGALRESKGVFVLLEAARRLSDRGLNFEIEFAGEWQLPDFREQAIDFVAAHALTSLIMWRGRVEGSTKWQAFADADLFCFPTFFEAETLGVVVLEAMQSRLPVVAADFRGVGSVVEPGVTGYLVPPRDAGALADRLAELLLDPARRRAFGEAGRRRYEARYTSALWLREMESALLSVRESG